MTEHFLQYIWQHNLFYKDELSINGKKIEIINLGLLNHDSGPDFFNAKIKIGDTVWAGNVEIHINSSDWFKHNHHTDKAYDNVILHAVLNNDTEVYNSQNAKIHTVELKFPDFVYSNYIELQNSPSNIACFHKIPKIPSIYINSWLDSLAVKRLERKSNEIEKTLNTTNNNWEESFYRLLFRHLGAKTNADSFEILAVITPLNILVKHKSSLLQIESILFGQAGFLDEINNSQNNYIKNLKREYKILKAKYNLQNMDKSQWKFLRLRPPNFPTVKIALASKLIFKSKHLFSQILETKELKELYNLFNVEVDGFWKNHYLFEKESTERKKQLGKQSIETLIINVIVPFLFVYGSKRNIEELKNRAISFLEQLQAEKNSIIKQWNSAGIDTKNAYQTQALLELYNIYCLHKKCLSCKLGYQILLKDDV